MGFIDYYSELGVAKDAPQEEIQRAYRKAARKFHPDVNKEAGADERFRRVAEAYEVLKDPEKRKKYDRFGSAWKSVREGQPRPRGPEFEGMPFDFGDLGGGRGASGFSSFFESLFGGDGFFGAPTRGGPFRGEGWVAQGRHHEARLELSLEEAARGGQRKIKLVDPGTGKERSYEVSIPRGVRPDQRIRLKGQGGTGVGGAPPGDLLLHIEHRPHPRFRLEGDDLHTVLEVSPWIAALGGEASLGTLHGRISVDVPAGSSSGRKIRLRGQGFPGTNGRIGDLYAEIRIVLPKSLSEEERELFQKLAEISRFEPEN